MNSQQKGKFYLDELFVTKKPEIVAAAFRDMQFVAVRSEMVYCSMQIEYYGISSKFKEIEKGLPVPEYRVNIFMNQEEGGPEEYSHVEVTEL